MDLPDITQGANKALAILRGSGAVGYAESGKVLWQGELGPTGGTSESGIKVTGAEVLHPLGFVEGRTYVVTTDSGTFNSVCKKTEDYTFYVGNGALLSLGDDTGETYAVAEIVEHDAQPFIVFLDYNGGAKGAVSTVETLHPIDPKYLPGVCLPVVEIATLPTADGAVLTEAESAVLNEVAALDIPIVMKAFDKAGDVNLTLVMSRMYLEEYDSTVFVNLFSVTQQFMLMYMDGSWMFSEVDTSGNTEE